MQVYTKLYGAFFICVSLALFAVSGVFRGSEKRGVMMRILLSLSSLAFYAYAGVAFVPILFYEAVVTYLSGILVKRRKWAFGIFTALQLCPFLIFKVMSFTNAGLFVPLGISFFALQSFTYNYRVNIENEEPERDFLTVFAFTSFFPCVSSGPIMRAGDLIPQIKNVRDFDYERCTDGLKLYCFGLFKKLVLGDNLALIIAGIRDNAAATSNHATALFFCAILYSFQLYFDFSGYSDIVVGCGKILGFELTRNFDHPYMSKTIGEFWRRWHISLSSFFRDYIYIPLGGSRKGLAVALINTMIVFVASGFWHGSGVGYIVWGLFHGFFVCLERLIKKAFPKYKGSILVTFLLVSFGWLFFSFSTVTEVWEYILSFKGIPGEIAMLFNDTGFGLSDMFLLPTDIEKIPVIFAGIVIFVLISVFTYKKDGLEMIRRQKTMIRWGAYYALMLSILFFSAGEPVNFIYNKF